MLNFSRWFLKGPWAILFIDEIIGMSWSNYSTPPCCCIPASLLRSKTLYIGERNSRRLSSLGHKNLKHHAMPNVVDFIYTFWLSLLSTSSILEWLPVESTFWDTVELLISMPFQDTYFEMFCYLKYLLTLPLFRHNKVTTEPITFKNLSYHLSRP